MTAIEQLRRITGVSPTEYSDAELAVILEGYPIPDIDGNFPEDDDWQPTYDIHAAAADIWEEKAAKLAGDYDFNADGASFNRSQAFQQAMEQVRYHRSHRAVYTARVIAYPKVRHYEELEDDDT